MNSKRNHQQFKVRSGVFSRKYVFPSGQVYGVAYHTPSQSVAIFEGDSANVWHNIWESNGDTTKALDYILQNGVYDNDPYNNACITLNSFIENLIDSNLLLPEDEYDHYISRDQYKHLTFQQIVDPELNTEQQVAQLMADHHILHSLTLEVTYSCNERCLHCYIPEHKSISQLSFAQIEALLTEFKALGGFSVLVTGGEPFIRNDIIEVFELIKSLGLVASLNSNLTLLNNHLLDAISNLYPRAVGCSIYSANPILHDSITRMQGSFNQSIEAIKQLKDRNIPVVIKSPLMKNTAPHWRQIEELAENLGCEIQFDLNITAQNDGGNSPLILRVDDTDVLADIFSNRFYKLFMRDEAIDTISTPSPEANLCGAGASSLSVAPDGTIYPCVALIIPLGHYPDTSLSQVWNHSDFFMKFNKLHLNDIEKCRRCKDFRFCIRCPGAWKSETGDYLIPPVYACKLAQVFSSTKNKKEVI